MRFVVKENVRAGLTAFANLTQQRVERAMDVAAVVVISNVKSRLKWRYKRGKGLGGRASGRLANSYAHKIKTTGTVTETTIGPGAKHGKYVEGYPTAPRRHFVSFKTAPGLLEWAMRHMGTIYSVRVSKNTGKSYVSRKRIDLNLGGGMMVGGEASTTPHLGPAMQTAGPRAMARLVESLRWS